jgi:hypothetical protein
VTFTEDSTAPAPPVIGASNPASPADDATPQLSGTAEPGSTVNLYATADCSGSPMATGTAAEFAAPGLTIVVAEGTTTAVRATATDVAGNVSGCGNAFSYVKTVPFLAPPVIIEKPVEKPVETPVQTPLAKDTTPPETKLTSVPKPTITATRATFRFSASEAGSTFRCRLDKKPFTVCRSPATYKKLKLGKHTFQVVAVDAAGNADPTPASKRFRVKKRRR